MPNRRMTWSSLPWLWLGLWGILILLCSLFIPGVLVNHFSSQPDDVRPNTGEPDSNYLTHASRQVAVPVYMTQSRQVEQVPLERYVLGVLAAEMPAEFELEALKAQALAARTYVIRRMLEQDRTMVPAAVALVTDTQAHQAYYSEEQLRGLWGSGYDRNLSKLLQAVSETGGLILLYDGQPINATYFSTSNGYTENSEDYWNERVPYLRSVASPWDKAISPKFSTTVILEPGTVIRKLGLPESALTSTGILRFKVAEKTAGGRVRTVQIGNRTFSGREVREKLGLNSSHFTCAHRGRQIECAVYGYGHGVGMSQWGANGMALAGKSAEQIVKHYYTGVTISRADAFLKEIQRAKTP